MLASTAARSGFRAATLGRPIAAARPHALRNNAAALRTITTDGPDSSTSKTSSKNTTYIAVGAALLLFAGAYGMLIGNPRKAQELAGAHHPQGKEIDRKFNQNQQRESLVALHKGEGDYSGKK
ncbi:hypothetical protein B0T24DRAFT_630742 [Lasiosphaeria ovina]|uniref:Uncharacterized protein n=1 Tax=Lasiosphaeria ovina TaxID=92902 RepID=A0AAE0K2H4_9PEZI|nr:hypothetical protein B0T24DRAFT_630742 [Lasiosphaeria ovina]